MKAIDVEKLTLELMDKHGLIDAGWVFKFDRAIRRSGCCHWDKQMITISKILSADADEALVRNTILHEIAHALSPRNAHHGPVWKAKAIEIGCTGRRFTPGYKYHPSKLKRHWIGVCDKCGHRTRPRARRLKLSCGACSRRFNPDLMLRWEEYVRTIDMGPATVTFGNNQKVKATQVQVQFADDAS